MHLDVAIPAAEAGCHLLLEKPLSHSLDRLDILRIAAQKSGSNILVGFQFRYHPMLNKARELIVSDALGKLLTVHAHWGEYLPQWHPWEDYRQGYAGRADLGGGVIVTLTHPLDYLRYLLGDVESLWSFNGHISPLEIDVEDVAEIGLKFASGAEGGVHLNYFQRPPVHRLEIVGTEGTLRWDNPDATLHFHRVAPRGGTTREQSRNRAAAKNTDPHCRWHACTATIPVRRRLTRAASLTGRGRQCAGCRARMASTNGRPLAAGLLRGHPWVVPNPKRPSRCRATR